MSWAVRRGRSFARHVGKAGFTVRFYTQPRSQFARTWENEPTFIAQWLRSLPKPVALMTCADYRSQQVIEACRIADLRVPEEVAVLGVDNDELVCELSALPLSSIALNFEAVGYEAAELLESLMSRKGTKARSIVLRPTNVVARQSTDILAIDDADVAQAVRFIRAHASDMIQVSDVVNAASVSRRDLYYKFKKHLGRSISHEIRRVRVQEIAAILLRTEMTVSQIASKLGYCSSDHISRYFRQEMKMSPLEYRRVAETPS
jgi:LacI family transcriptional regulator